MRGGECWELSTPVLRTSEKESGSWPTPTRNDAVGAGYQRANGNHYFTLPGAVGATKHLPPAMEEKRVKIWPTPQAHKTTESGEIVNADGTPWDGIRKPHSKTSGRPITTALADAVALWPTPRSQDAKHGSCTDYELSRDKGKDLLHVAVERMRTWPTPVASMTKENQNPRTPGTKGTQTTLAIEAGGSLNPTWVEWLMGWPLGWTDLKPLETARFRQWCASHGKY